MVAITEGAAALGVLKSAYELLRDLRKSSDPSVLKAGLEEVTERLLAAREDAFKMAQDFDALLGENKRLRAEISSNQAWETEEKRYQLREIFPGSFAFVLNDGIREGEPQHTVCPTCFKQKQISIMQKVNAVQLGCQVCKTQIDYRNSSPITTRVVRS
jgi:hypothetical protein